jgi:ABC-type phosphate transport system substrate-binding protein
MKKGDFDLAIIPSERYEQIKEFNKTQFKLQNISFDISALFDYNFSKYLQNNTIKAIPFAIDPIVGYANIKNNKIATNLTFEDWKNIIITNENRLTPSGKIQTMPVFL